MGTERTHREAALARIAERQFGVFTHAQAFDQGFTANTIKKRLHRGVWALADHNVYRMSATPRTWNQRLLAACLAGPAVASHRSAGILWGLSGMPDELETVLNEGIRRNLLSRSAIGRRLDELGTLRPGTTVVQAVVGRHRPGRRAPESVLETRFLQLLRTAGLPEPAPQFEIGLGDGAAARVDFAYPKRRIAIELDGAAYHSGEVAERRDRRRDNRLGAIGWRVLRFGWNDVTRSPDYVLGMMRALGA